MTTQNEILVTWKSARAVWWFIAWRWGVIALLSGIVGEAVDREFDRLFMSYNAAWVLVFYAPLLIAFVCVQVAATMLVCKSALSHRYGRFHIALISDRAD